MPEGHTIHRLARRHQTLFRRQHVAVSSPQGRFIDGADAVNGRLFTRASAWGKHLFHHYEGGHIVHVHLGLYGKFDVHRGVREVPDPVGQVRLRLSAPATAPATATARRTPTCAAPPPAS